MPNYVAPAADRSTFTCIRCGALSHHDWVDLRVHAFSGAAGKVVSVEFDDSKGEFAMSNGRLVVRLTRPDKVRWKASYCVACEQMTVWNGSEIVYPQLSPIVAPHPDMPTDAAELYEEARNVFPVSRRASAALARAALERLLRSISGAGPKDRLDGLIADLHGRVGAPLWKLLTALRYLGNTTLHGEEEQELVALFLDGEGAGAAEPYFGAMNAVVEELITQPQKADDLYAMIPENVRADAEAKGAKASSSMG
ncbi:DUF4145 domain-containing protein [Plantibacter sp. VKM Ac-2880]|uniref:DUF4145 domain-containing protein n=1 Tax=Plantibacter sp. VKM Ac-2880 TaxID=2783827 RepID=UPI00188F5039|nr:DUF4145 domain-containing protein [Plantibacter sp. VKM Ac-2880]MBF4568518.1 DUF4145 domain-containing protein [Plantibacter sp. VKM Ac-2880]